MIAGLGVLAYAAYLAIRARRTEPSTISLPLPGGKNIELKGPAWLLFAAIGVLMLAAPVLAAFGQHIAHTTAPQSVQQVQRAELLPMENREAFEFVRDLGILDLRESQSQPWYSSISFLKSANKLIKPAIFRNVMIVRKKSPANNLIMHYSTSGTLVVRCLSHEATYTENKDTSEEDKTDTWAVSVDVSAVPLNTDFEVIVEATYYDAFSTIKQTDFTQYANKQDEPEDVSLAIIFPEDKKMKSISVEEIPPFEKPRPFTGTARAFPAEQNSPTENYYWTTTNTRSGYYYHFTWDW